MTGRIWVPPGCCQSRRRPRRSVLAARCGSFGTMGTCTLSTKGPPRYWRCPVTWWWPDMRPPMSTLCGYGTPSPPNRWTWPYSPGGSISRPPRRRPWQRPLPKFSTPRTIITRASRCGSSSSISLCPPRCSPLPKSTWTCMARCATSMRKMFCRSTIPIQPW